SRVVRDRAYTRDSLLPSVGLGPRSDQLDQAPEDVVLARLGLLDAGDVLEVDGDRVVDQAPGHHRPPAVARKAEADELAAAGLLQGGEDVAGAARGGDGE